MRGNILIGMDDTDVLGAPMGTGKLSRTFAATLGDLGRVVGVLRLQFLVAEGIPYTSHNSSACVVLAPSDPKDTAGLVAEIVRRGAAWLEEKACQGSDPGLCVAYADDVPARLTAFGRTCTHRRVTRDEAFAAASGLHLSCHGGTCDGVIGASGGVGLVAGGWSGRFIEFGDLRAFPDPVPVGELEAAGIHVLSLERDATEPAPDDLVRTNNWLRPRLWGGRAVLPVNIEGPGMWISPYRKGREAKEA